MEIQIVPTRQFATVAADHIVAHLRFKEVVRICFAAGNTPTGPYSELVRRYQTGELDISHLRAFTLDEYAGIPRTHPRSCFQSLTRNLYHGLELKDDQTRTYDDNVMPAEAAYKYELTVMSEGGFDFSILGIGLNGHVGFNEPGTPRESRTHVTPLADTTMKRAREEGWVDAPTTGLTLGIATLMESKSVLLIANGRHKADIIARIVQGEIGEDVPASWFRDHPNAVLLLDEEAASGL